jgi:NADH-quinone oxidoreductase subunit C
MAEQPPAAMAAVPCESQLAKDLKAQFGEQVREVSTYRGQDFAVVDAAAAVPVLEYLKYECNFDYLVDITAVDCPKRTPRFELIYIAYSFSRNERFRVKTHIGEGEKAQTATGVHLTADWLEREVFDMFGIAFAGHPNMKRILMPEDWQGHPLRKDYSITGADERWVKENLGIEGH